MRYSAIDIMRDRTSGKVIEGDEQHPSEAVEMWTFVRRGGNDNWQVAAIQAAA
ncbi:Tim44-like domain protein [compost metagenome]